MAANKGARPKPMPKSGVYQELAGSTNLTKKEVAAVFDSLFTLIERELGKKGPGIFALPGMLKVKLVQKPATKPRMGRNPQTGEQIMIAAKPARRVVKAQVLKNLKELAK